MSSRAREGNGGAALLNEPMMKLHEKCLLTLFTGVIFVLLQIAVCIIVS